MKSNLAVPLGDRRLPLRSLLLASVLLLQLAPEAFGRDLPAQPRQDACDWTSATRALGALRAQKGVVMTELWVGPEILWRTDFSVVGAPYEIAPAIADTARFENSTGKAGQILAKRRIDYVLTCGARSDAAALGLVPLAFAAPGFHLYRAAH